MGAFGFIAERLGERLAPGQKLRYLGRPPSPSPATGSHRVHEAEEKALLEEAFKGLRIGEEVPGPAEDAAAGRSAR